MVCGRPSITCPSVCCNVLKKGLACDDEAVVFIELVLLVVVAEVVARNNYNDHNMVNMDVSSLIFNDVVRDIILSN